MNPTLTYRPKFTSTNIGEYRYFFNGQEADNEVFVQVKRIFCPLYLHQLMSLMPL